MGRANRNVVANHEWVASEDVDVQLTDNQGIEFEGLVTPGEGTVYLSSDIHGGDTIGLMCHLGCRCDGEAEKPSRRFADHVGSCARVEGQRYRVTFIEGAKYRGLDNTDTLGGGGSRLSRSRANKEVTDFLTSTIVNRITFLRIITN